MRRRLAPVVRRAWLAYRRAWCRSVSDTFGGGSEAPVAFATCEVTLTRRHIADLTAFARGFS